MRQSFTISLDQQKIYLQMASKKMTVADLAKRIGRSRVSVYNWINNCNLSPVQAGVLAEALEVEVKDLI